MTNRDQSGRYAGDPLRRALGEIEERNTARMNRLFPPKTKAAGGDTDAVIISERKVISGDADGGARGTAGPAKRKGMEAGLREGADLMRRGASSVDLI